MRGQFIITNVFLLSMTAVFVFISIYALEDGLKRWKTLVAMILTIIIFFAWIYNSYMLIHRSEQLHLMGCHATSDEYANIVNIRENTFTENGITQTNLVESVYYIYRDEFRITFKELCELGYEIRPKRVRLWINRLTNGHEIVRVHDSFEQIIFDIIPKDEN